jgi:large subunit ribosomal protein L10
MRHALIVDFTGVSAQQADDLRAKLGERGSRMFVVRNSLAVLALRQLELLEVSELLSGPCGFIYGGDDPAGLAKMVFEWAKAEKVLTVRGGMLDGRALDAQGVKALAALPPVNVLRAQALGAMAAPLSGLVGALSGVARGLVTVLDAIAEKQGASEG